MDGVSLVDLMNGSRRRSGSGGVFAESLYPERFGWSPLRALRDGRFKLIDAPRPELYDLERDPFEERNIFDERRPLADAMMRRLEALDPRQRFARASEETCRPGRVAGRSRGAGLRDAGADASLTESDEPSGSERPYRSLPR